MTDHLIAILLLCAMFVIATLLPINIGVLAFVGAFLVGTLVAGVTTRDIIADFPSGLFLTLAGITWLFALAQNNGTIDWIVRAAVRAVKGRVGLIPWIMFAIAAVLTSIGAVTPGAVAIVAPIALSFAFRYQISPLLMGMMVAMGASAGAFSPLGIFGGITNGVVERAGLPLSPLTTAAASFLCNGIVVLILFMMLGGRELMRARADLGEAYPVPHVEIARSASGPQIFGDSEAEALSKRVAKEGGGGDTNKLVDDVSYANMKDGSPVQILTLVGLAAVALMVLAFKMDIGFVSLTVGLLIALCQPTHQKRSVGQIAWPEIMLITGVGTYIAVLENMGTIDFVGNSVASMASPMLAALLLFYIGGIVSAFASSTALLGALIPLAVPFLQGDGGIGAISFIAGMAVASTIVDVSPFSTSGALVLANAQGIDRQIFFKQLMKFGTLVTLVSPLVLWLIFVVIPN
ncbi:hypothetical protein GCM10011402_26280 [Paracoccus acridae]|uniref:Dicarboxylate carrier MatC N-terminal domain-containing protein n=1 Tax=Paracoccus acridae TaxID=1795310 RepID=A0ABQ1VL27_9RHOB|nr:SLC13 family permease [Paracoccus acridae]GGF72442.1 hypothetical protein GCM10011402_26280 [Paracoccus acridae]